MTTIKPDLLFDDEGSGGEEPADPIAEPGEPVAEFNELDYAFPNNPNIKESIEIDGVVLRKMGFGYSANAYCPKCREDGKYEALGGNPYLKLMCLRCGHKSKFYKSDIPSLIAKLKNRHQ